MNPSALTERFEMRLGQSVLDEVDSWRARQGDLPSRSEAVRRLVEQGLAADAPRDKRRDIKLGDGEKLILMMLCELFGKLKINGDLDPAFIEEVIIGGHFWALDWKYTGIFHGHEDSTDKLRETVDVLDMWSFLEYGYEKLSKKDKDRVAKEAEPFGKDVKLHGFDGNNESEYMGIARFMIEQLDRFSKFKGRDLNAHMPTLEAHRRMLAVFQPLRNKMAGRDLNADEIIETLKAMLHPSRRNARGDIAAR
jgi:uncharacterized protein